MKSIHTKTYENVRAAFNKNNIFYETEYDNTSITAILKCNRFNVKLNVALDFEANIISFQFLLPFIVFEKSIEEIQYAICRINEQLNNFGSFNLSIYAKNINFRVMSVLCENCAFSVNSVEYTIFKSLNIIANYIDNLFMLSRCMMTFEEFDTIDLDE